MLNTSVCNLKKLYPVILLVGDFLSIAYVIFFSSVVSVFLFTKTLEVGLNYRKVKLSLYNFR